MAAEPERRADDAGAAGDPSGAAGDGTRALFVNEHFTTTIVGLPPEESEALLATLYEQATRPAFVYRHRWQPHDLVFWDNRSVQHLAAGCPPEQRRTVYRTTIEGDVPS